MKYLVYVD